MFQASMPLVLMAWPTMTAEIELDGLERHLGARISETCCMVRERKGKGRTGV